MKRMGITAKLVFGVACILVGLGLLVTVHSVFQLETLLRQQMHERVEAQAKNWIAENSGIISFTGQQETLDLLVSKLRRESWIAYVILLDSKGMERASVDVPEGLQEERPELDETATQGWMEKEDARALRYFELTTLIPPFGTELGSDDLRAMWAAAAPAEVSSSGWLRVGVDQQEFERRLHGFARRNVILAGFLVLLAVGASVLFARRMVTPITEMGKVATRIASGDLQQRVERGAGLRDEVGDLVRNFNHMAQRLKENREEMDLLYAGLEEKVHERTLELEEANRKLEERDTLRSEFVSTVSHEARTPLTSIKLFARILLEAENPTPERVKRGLQIIDEETDRTTRLITDVLDLRRLELGVVNWRMTDTDLGEIVRKPAEQLSPQATEREIELKVAGLEQQRARADPEWIQRVTANLIGNAIKFCSPGCRVEVGLGRATSSGPERAELGEYALVWVSDNGPGIPQEELQRVFEPFYLAKKRPSAAAGTGLGLAISKRIVSHHKGEIWAESSVGSGSTFYFTLPLGTTRTAMEPHTSSVEGERRS